jgi:hypothetical protein
MLEIKLETDEEDTFNPVTHDRVEIMSNGWVKAIDQTGDHKEYTQYPPHRVMEINGEVTYYER